MSISCKRECSKWTAAGTFGQLIGSSLCACSFAGVLALTGVMVGNPALAAGFTVQSGESVGPQTMDAAGDSGTVESGGTINGGATYAVTMSADNQVLTNGGLITTTGFGAWAVNSDGDDATITNSGSISTVGISAFGIISASSNGTVINNSGSISTDGDTAYGILAANSNDVVINNSGSISTTKINAFGIYSFSSSANTIINNSGSISTIWDDTDGIRSRGIAAEITSSGPISTMGNSADGIFSDGIDAVISNSGLISTAGDAAYGINSEGGDAVITNGGSVSTTGVGAWGIRSNGDDATITNSGSISTEGTSAFGIALDVSDATVVSNSGLIITDGISSYGILSGDSDDVVITNDGKISTTQQSAHGVFSTSTSDDTLFINRGAISVAGVSANGAYLAGTNAEMINSGHIASSQADAILFSAADNRLTLLPGSVLEGGLTFGGGSDTLVVENGLSIASTFDKAPDILDTRGAPFVVSGTLVAVVDTTGFSALNNTFSDLAGGISNTLGSRLSETANGSAGLNHTTTGLNSGDEMRISSANDSAPDGGSWWLKGFGGYRDLNGSGTSVDSKNRFGGAMMGFDRKGGGDTTLGLFVGLSRSELEVDYNAQDIETTSYFGGIYGRYGDNLGFAITGGITGHDSDRHVANNLVAGGIETAKTDYDGYFVAPEVTFSMDAIAFGSIKVKPSIRARYTYFNIDGYAENGTASNLTVEDRDGHTLDGRLQLAFPIRSEPGLNFELRAGVDGRVSNGDRDVDATLLGQALSFDPGGEESSFSVFIGGHYIKRLSPNSSLFVAAEVGFGNETNIRADVQAGVNVVF